LIDLAASVLEACRRGDASAFRALVDAYQDRVYALCAALAGGDAEDLMQETFLRVHGAIARFDPEGPATLGGFILTIARRLCRDRARAARVRLIDPDAFDAADGDRPASGASPLVHLEQRRLRGRILSAIFALPEEQRAAVALREWDGLSYEEIAVIEGVPVGTVRSRLSRAKETLRIALKDEVERDAG
jgi:RNA polymerase sigma-70 factor (ECF subfamily)